MPACIWVNIGFLDGLVPSDLMWKVLFYVRNIVLHFIVLCRTKEYSMYDLLPNIFLLPVARRVLHDIFIFTHNIMYGWPQEVRGLLFGHPWPSTISVCMPTSELTTPDLRCIQSVEYIPRIMLTEAIFDIKTLSYHYMNSHYKDEIVSRPPHIHKGNFYTGKTTSWYWISLLVLSSLLLFFGDLLLSFSIKSLMMGCKTGRLFIGNIITLLDCLDPGLGPHGKLATTFYTLIPECD